MTTKRSKLLTAIAILIFIDHLFGVITSFPLSHVTEAILKGGISTQGQVGIEKVAPNSPAEMARLIPGDIILSINGKPITDAIEVTNATSKSDEPVSLEIKRQENIQKVTLTPRPNPPAGQGKLGLVISNETIHKKPLQLLIPEAVIQGYSGQETKLISFPLSESYKDTSYRRLQKLILGIVGVVIAIGLWKMKKWAVYGVYFLAVYNIIISATYIFVQFPKDLQRIPAPVFNPQFLVIDLIFIGINICLQFFFVFVVYKNRHLFQAKQSR
jgi:membrane-associated protease RseP (regulator of RpoE activity)